MPHSIGVGSELEMVGRDGHERFDRRAKREIEIAVDTAMAWLVHNEWPAWLNVDHRPVDGRVGDQRAAVASSLSTEEMRL